MTGLLLVDKPTGWTSFDVVNYVRKTVAASQNVPSKSIKVGHCGTLDPIASGLLILLIGKEYTAKAMELTKLDKVYEVELKLGVTSPSMDTETVVEKVSDKKPTVKEIEAAVNSFVGELSQMPPIYSALKVDGQRAYNLARKGQDVKLEPRNITIYNLKLDSYSYPKVNLTAEVSSGTYIRSLVNDIGKKLGTGAIMTQLKRTKIGKYSLDNAVDVKKLKPKLIAQKLRDI